jgi:hypothetical protein
VENDIHKITFGKIQGLREKYGRMMLKLILGECDTIM